MKYEVKLNRNTTIGIPVFAESPLEALISARDSHSGEFKVVDITEIIEDADEPGEETRGKTFDVECYCEACGNPILTGDAFHQWCGEDAIATCLKCGGTDAFHGTEIAGE